MPAFTDSTNPYQVSFLLFAYNQEKTVAAAVESALAQIGDPIEIILSDDASSDNTFAVMHDLAAGYSGPHRVRARRSPVNRGVIHHVNDVVNEASGELLVFAAGDDVSLPERTVTIVDAWRKSGAGTAALYSNYYPVDEQGRPVSLGDSYFFAGQHTLEGMAGGFIEAFGGSAAYTRDLFTRFPAIRPDVIHEDRVFPFRALLAGGQVIAIKEKLVRYTVAGGVSRQRLPTGMKDFALRYFPNQQLRIMSDARQRESDAATIVSPQSRIGRLCRRTTVTQETIVAMSQRRGLYREAALARGLLARAQYGTVLRHYLKLRLPIPYRGAISVER